MQAFLDAIEDELHQVIDLAKGPSLELFYRMLAYHMGWEGEKVGVDARGKRVRPLLLLLSHSASGGNWRDALPAAAAVELVHNFSLIHDDIQDNSPLRRGRPTVWHKWGVPQAINCGDAMFTLAHLALSRLSDKFPATTVLETMAVLDETCLRLTQGQFLDIAYEARNDLSLESYWPMVGGKTAALLSACTESGALLANVDMETREAYREFGEALGLAFQVKDDILGIWGDGLLTGKSSESDLLSGKKSLPVLYGLEKKGPFAERWRRGSVSLAEVPDLATQLESEGAYQYTNEVSNRLTEQALDALARARPHGDSGEALRALAIKLLHRDS